MLRRELEVTDREEIEKILEKGKVVHVGMTDGDQPYVIPMNYGYCWQDDQLVLYLHGGKQGYKYEVIRRNPKVCFEISCDIIPFRGKVACQFGMSYSCLIGKGVAEMVQETEEKARSLRLLMMAQTGEDTYEFDEKLCSIVQVVRITSLEFTAKKRPLPPVSFE